VNVPVPETDAFYRVSLARPNLTTTRCGTRLVSSTVFPVSARSGGKKNKIFSVFFVLASLGGEKKRRVRRDSRSPKRIKNNLANRKHNAAGFDVRTQRISLCSIIVFCFYQLSILQSVHDKKQ